MLFICTFRKVGGIGAVTEQMLLSLDITTCGDVWNRRGLINLLFKPSTTSFLLKVATGNGQGFMSRDEEENGNGDRKSISCERTFSDTSNVDELKDICFKACSHLQEKLKRKELLCKVVCLKLKTSSFDVKTRVKTLSDFTCDLDTLFHNAWRIFQSFENELGNNLQLRLLGVRFSNLKSIRVPVHGIENQRSDTTLAKQKRIDSFFYKQDTKQQDHSTQLPYKSIPSDDLLVSQCRFKSGELNILLDIFADPLPHESSIVCPICGYIIAKLDDPELEKQIHLDMHFESCILTSFEECGILIP